MKSVRYETQGAPKRPPQYPWLVPIVLLIGIALAFVAHWPMYAGLLIAYAGSLLYTKCHYGTWRQIFIASCNGMQKMWKVCVVLLLIGGVMSLWMAGGTIPTLVQLSTRFVHSDDILWMSFICSAVLSLTVGSAIATWSVLGPTFMVMASPQLAPWVAGALLSGGMVGDRSSPMSTSALLVSTTCRQTPAQTLRQLNRSALLPIVFCILLWMLINHTLLGTANTTRMDALQHGVAFWMKCVPPVIVIALALCRVPLIYNFILTFVIALLFVLLEGHPTLHQRVAQIWMGTPFHQEGHVLVVGGVLHMVSAVLLIAVAGAFQGVTELGGSIGYLAHETLAKISSKNTFVVVAYLISLIFSLVMGSQMIAILMSANTLRPEFEQRGFKESSLVQVIGDAPELLPAVIPWNLLGFQASVILGMPSTVLGVHAFFIPVMIAFSISLVFLKERQGSRCYKSNAK